MEIGVTHCSNGSSEQFIGSVHTSPQICCCQASHVSSCWSTIATSTSLTSFAEGLSGKSMEAERESFGLHRTLGGESVLSPSNYDHHFKTSSLMDAEAEWELLQSSDSLSRLFGTSETNQHNIMGNNRQLQDPITPIELTSFLQQVDMHVFDCVCDASSNSGKGRDQTYNSIFCHVSNQLPLENMIEASHGLQNYCSCTLLASSSIQKEFSPCFELIKNSIPEYLEESRLSIQPSPDRSSQPLENLFVPSDRINTNSSNQTFQKIRESSSSDACCASFKNDRASTENCSSENDSTVPSETYRDTEASPYEIASSRLESQMTIMPAASPQIYRNEVSTQMLCPNTTSLVITMEDIDGLYQAYEHGANCKTQKPEGGQGTNVNKKKRLSGHSNAENNSSTNPWEISEPSFSSNSALLMNNIVSCFSENLHRVKTWQSRQENEAISRPKRRNVHISKDPQTVAARLRRERISSKMRTLQRLVPGGTKMDTASMLDEAIQYVKYLKLQLQTMELLESNGTQCPAFPHIDTYFGNHSVGTDPQYCQIPETSQNAWF